MAGSRSAARDPPGRVRYSAASGTLSPIWQATDVPIRTLTNSIADRQHHNPEQLLRPHRRGSGGPAASMSPSRGWSIGSKRSTPRISARLCSKYHNRNRLHGLGLGALLLAMDGSRASPLVLDGGIYENAMDLRAHSFGNSLRRLRNDGFGCADHTDSRSKGREVREPIWFDSSTAPTHSAIGPSIHHDSPLPAEPAPQCAIEKVAACVAPGGEPTFAAHIRGDLWRSHICA